MREAREPTVAVEKGERRRAEVARRGREQVAQRGGQSR